MSRGRWSKLLAIGGIAGAALVALSFAAGVINFTYSERTKYEAVGHQAASTESEKGQVETGCLDRTEPDAVVRCVREEAAAEYKQQREDADLYAQQDMAAFAHGLLWFGALSFITGAGGLIALIWTFREQRKLTANASRAYLEIVSARATIEDQAGFRLTLEIYNGGQTPATDIRLQGHVHFSPDNEWGTQEKRTVRNDLYGGTLHYVPPRAVHLMIAGGGDDYPAPTYPTPTAWRYVGPSFHIKGKITYKDAFGDSQELPLDLSARDLWGDYRRGIEFYGAHSSRKIEREKPQAEEAGEKT